MKTMITSFEFDATHSLDVREEVHLHQWILTVGISGKMVEGYLFNLSLFRDDIERGLTLVKDTYLNKNTCMSSAVRHRPTCENLCDFFWEEVSKIVGTYREKNKTIFLSFLEVAIKELGVEIGRIRREC